MTRNKTVTLYVKSIIYKFGKHGGMDDDQRFALAVVVRTMKELRSRKNSSDVFISWRTVGAFRGHFEATKNSSDVLSWRLLPCHKELERCLENAKNLWIQKKWSEITTFRSDCAIYIRNPFTHPFVANGFNE